MCVESIPDSPIESLLKTYAYCCCVETLKNVLKPSTRESNPAITKYLGEKDSITNLTHKTLLRRALTDITRSDGQLSDIECVPEHLGIDQPAMILDKSIIAVNLDAQLKLVDQKPEVALETIQAFVGAMSYIVASRVNVPVFAKQTELSAMVG